MLKSVTFTEDYRCFKKGESIPFVDGLNLLVGDQGCGKSTLISAIADSTKRRSPPVKIDYLGSGTFYYHDFEKMNPRHSRTVEFGWQVAMMKSSHGETVLAILDSLNRESNCLWLIDEPDMALSIKSIFKLNQLLQDAVKRGCQLIVSVHNPLLISLAESVYSLEHRKRMTGQEFIELCKE